MTDDNTPAPQVRPDPSRRVVDIPGPNTRRRQSPSDGQGKKLLVGREIRLSGEITACDTLVVEGSVEATLTDSRVIEVAQSGVFKGAADIEIAEISGIFEGNITARKLLIIRSTGRVTGKVRASQMEVERGGEISGEIEILPEAE